MKRAVSFIFMAFIFVGHVFSEPQQEQVLRELPELEEYLKNDLGYWIDYDEIDPYLENVLNLTWSKKSSIMVLWRMYENKEIHFFRNNSFMLVWMYNIRNIYRK
jgi:hypothetical protein